MADQGLIRYAGKDLPVQQAIIEIAKDEGIPPSGITILGGKPYINVTGLDCKVRTKCKEEKLTLAGVSYEIIQTVNGESKDGRAGGWGIVKFFDKPGFEKALAGLKGTPITKDILDSLKEMYLQVFKMRGYASPATLGMESMKKADNVEHMAERRATNRAKREATGTGLTSVDEMEHGGTTGESEPPKKVDAKVKDTKAETSPPAGSKPPTKKTPPAKPQTKKPDPPPPPPAPEPEPPAEPEPHVEDPPTGEQREPGADENEGENLVPEGDSGLRPVWIKMVSIRKDEKNNPPEWTLYGVKCQDEGEVYYANTFSDTHGALAEEIKQKAVYANVTWEWAIDNKTGQRKLFNGKPSRNLLHIEEIKT